MHYFGESGGYGFHRYPDGYVAVLPVKEGYANAFSQVYEQCIGHKNVTRVFYENAFRCIFGEAASTLESGYYSIGAPEGYEWLPKFKSDGSISTGSSIRDGRPFFVIRRLTRDEADENEFGVIDLWRIRFLDGDREEFTAWSEEIMKERE